MDDDETFVRDLILKMAGAVDLDLTGLAREAGIAPSTLTRFMNGDAKHLPSARTLFKLSKLTHVPIVYGESELPDTARIEVLNAVAQALGLSAEGKRPPEEWADVIDALPPPARDSALATLQGVAEAIRSKKRARRRRK